MSRPVMHSSVILASAARGETAGTATDAMNNRYYKGVRLFLDITAKTGTTPTLDVKVQIKDIASTDWIDLTGAAFAQQNAEAQLELVIYPAIPATANVSVNGLLDREWRLYYVIGGTATPTFTFSVGATLIQ